VSFNADIKKFAQAIDVDVEAAVRNIAFIAYNGLTKKTPVDTGRARANWNIGINKIDTSTTKAKKDSEGNHVDSSTPPSSPRAKEASIKPGDGNNVIYITNSLPYIGKLEGGDHSKQAPNGMVAVTINEIRSHIQDVIQK